MLFIPSLFFVVSPQRERRGSKSIITSLMIRCLQARQQSIRIDPGLALSCTCSPCFSLDPPLHASDLSILFMV